MQPINTAKQVNNAHYEFNRYISKHRFASFWTQVKEVLAFKPQSVLEAGPGPGIVTDILRKQKVAGAQERIAVTTVDYADDVGADVIASVLDLPFKDGAFDVSLCCQVLEHLEFSHFAQAVSELARVTQKGVVLSLPDPRRLYRFMMGAYPFRFAFSLPFMPAKKHVFDGEHYWEIGKKGYPIKRIMEVLNHEFREVRRFRVFEFPYHHFFICQKSMN